MEVNLPDRTAVDLGFGLGDRLENRDRKILHPLGERGGDEHLPDLGEGAMVVMVFLRHLRIVIVVMVMMVVVPLLLPDGFVVGVFGMDGDVGPGDARLRNGFTVEMDRFGEKRGDRRGDRLKIGARIRQRRKDHIAAGAPDTIHAKKRFHPNTV